ncbi:hypothetical protein LPB67_15270 [Undibacterium sp. Jales W-56]|uniref:hypothetical protein n=1 Tax=Undibacterium sp. Jales W-56 TaxID=2897325 RepID=UPI0021D1C5D3|nr:hypothetical protein [Undibacterium sp. Jales W-56]MCU6435137.1 hypothetical protein [Undibacterium sp. Jales W-56]
MLKLSLLSLRQIVLGQNNIEEVPSKPDKLPKGASTRRTQVHFHSKLPAFSV